ncbi:hypothetical protein A2U01_0051844, partial [Trifolium medium]|nr:hypothetical protein [Trifolium medium]
MEVITIITRIQYDSRLIPPGFVARFNGWNEKQVQSDRTSLLSFTGWYETSLQENRLIE